MILKTLKNFRILSEPDDFPIDDPRYFEPGEQSLRVQVYEFVEQKLFVQQLVSFYKDMPRKITSIVRQQRKTCEASCKTAITRDPTVSVSSKTFAVIQDAIRSLGGLEKKKSTVIDKELSILSLEYGRLEKLIKKRNESYQKYRYLLRDYNRTASSGYDAKRLQKAKEKFSILNAQVAGDLDSADDLYGGIASDCLQVVQGFYTDIFSSWSLIVEGLSESMAAEIEKISVDCINDYAAIPFERFDSQLPQGQLISPRDVPTCSLLSQCLSPIEQDEEQGDLPKFKVTRPQVAIRKQSFEEIHKQNAPSSSSQESEEPSRKSSLPPPLPSGQSRVAALKAQLEATGFIIRPMTPNNHVKPKKSQIKDDDEGNDSSKATPIDKPFNPFAKRFVVKKKLEVAPKAPKKTYVIAEFDYVGMESGDLSFKHGDKIEVINETDSCFDWWNGRLRGVIGVFPANYTRPL